jgi:hypothetical protein
MDVEARPISRCVPHSQAEMVLFKHKREALAVFSDVIGLCEIDHLSMAYINRTGEAVFLSHTPAIEYHLMTSPLWVYDAMHHHEFYQNDTMKLWSELYHVDKYFELADVKQVKHGFVAGCSVPVKHPNGHVIYSFATRTRPINPRLFFFERESELIGIGNYCFNQLSDILLAHAVDHHPVVPPKTHRHLTLVVNHQRQSPRSIEASEWV